MFLLFQSKTCFPDTHGGGQSGSVKNHGNAMSTAFQASSPTQQMTTQVMAVLQPFRQILRDRILGISLMYILLVWIFWISNIGRDRCKMITWGSISGVVYINIWDPKNIHTNKMYIRLIPKILSLRICLNGHRTAMTCVVICCVGEEAWKSCACGVPTILNTTGLPITNTHGAAHSVTTTFVQWLCSIASGKIDSLNLT